MVRYLLMALSALLIGYSSQSQISINLTGAPPNVSAMVDISSTNRGLLIPRMTQAQRGTIVLPATGLLIYQTDGVPGFYYNVGVPALPAWIPFLSSTSGWRTIGNSGINPSTNFVGTTDNNALHFRINNILGGQLDPETGNAFFGLRAGLNNSTGFSNIAVGIGALLQNTIRSNLVAIGDSALFNNGIGAIGTNPASGNTAVGSKALFNNNTGFFNSAYGFQSLLNNTAGSANVAGGYQSLLQNTTGSNNTANGASSLSSNVNGINNTATGSQSLFLNTSGSNNSASGFQTLFSNTTGQGNTAGGNQALFNNSTGEGNTANGNQALFSNTTGYSNIAIGVRALYSNTTRSGLVAIGDSALFNNGIFATASSEATGNTAVGSKALFSNREGYSNTAIGYQALNGSNSNYNSGFGYQALSAFDPGDGNTAVGYNSLSSFLDGGSVNTAVGFRADVDMGVSGSMALGSFAQCTGSGQVRIGSASISSIGGFEDWTNFSDGRFKKNILDNIPGLSFIQQLRPISYTLDLQAIEDFLWPGNSRYAKMDAAEFNSFKAITEPAKRIKEKIVYSGFIAQEVEAAAKHLGFDFSGVDAPKNERDLYGLRYAEFVVPLVKAVQELADQNAKLNENTNSQLLIIQEQNRKIESLMQQNEKLLKQIAIINKKLNIE